MPIMQLQGFFFKIMNIHFDNDEVMHIETNKQWLSNRRRQTTDKAQVL